MTYDRTLATIENRQVTKRVKNKETGVTELVTTKFKYINIDDTKLDIFKTIDINDIPDWKPNVSLKPYSELIRVCLDIETTGLNWRDSEITLVGIINESGKKLVLSREDYSEPEILQRLFTILKNKDPDIISVFNGFEFDLPFINGRASLYNIESPFVKGKRTVTFRTAQKFNNQPTQYIPYYFSSPTKKDCAIIDIYHQVLAWDFVSRSLSKHSLKVAPYEMGLVKEERKELTYQAMMNIWHKFQNKEGNLTELIEYLEYDLEHTKLLTDYLVPPIYFSKILLNGWKLQSLSTAGNGSKWNDILRVSYNGVKDFENNIVRFNRNGKQYEIKADTPKKFEGGYTLGKAGIFQYVAKLDVSSLYPSCILLYYIYSHSKDPDAIFPKILKYLWIARLEHKELAGKDGADPIWDQLQGFEKVFINSGYGGFATTGIPFNDYICAAFVTAYGRAIAKHMKRVIEAHNGFVIEVDTDGLIYTIKGLEGLIDPSQKLKKIFYAVQASLPKGIGIEYEWEARLFYNPKRDKLQEGDENTGKRKNYVLLGITEYRLNKKKEIEFKKFKEEKAIGIFRKRNFCQLQKRFKVDCLKIYLDAIDQNVNPYEAAYNYYKETVKKIQENRLDIEEIIVRRKVAVSEKKLVDLGLVKDDGTTEFYYKDIVVRMKTKMKWDVQQTNTGAYSFRHYTAMIEKQWSELDELFKIKDFNNLPEYHIDFFDSMEYATAA